MLDTLILVIKPVNFFFLNINFLYGQEMTFISENDLPVLITLAKIKFSYRFLLCNGMDLFNVIIYPSSEIYYIYSYQRINIGVEKSRKRKKEKISNKFIICL